MKPDVDESGWPLWVLSPVPGAIAPAAFFATRNLLASSDGANLGLFTVWGLRDLALGYCVALPLLVLLSRLGVTHILLLWAAASVLGGPVGYAVANPVEFAWTPTEEQFTHGPYWGLMAIYMALFGLSGAFFSLVSLRAKHRQSENVA